MNNTTTTAKKHTNLRKFRKAKGLTQKELAKLISCHWTSIINWEKGVSQPYGRRLKLLCAILNISPLDILL